MGPDEIAAFNRYCPGLGYRPPVAERGVGVDELWGPVRDVRIAWAADESVRLRGSSGGALTAMIVSLLESATVDAVVALSPDSGTPLRNEARVIRRPGEALLAAGSRYAPGAPMDRLMDLPGSARIAVVGKPCDIAGLRHALATDSARFPTVVVLLSFFCAGQPSEVATREVLEELAVGVEDVTTISYRGNGWPGAFSVTTGDGETREMPYSEAWGRILNKHLHNRCKTCIDSVGHHADVVAADMWETDERGYPSFAEGDGQSAVIVRTRAGAAIYDHAVGSAQLSDKALDIDQLKRVQPYQVERRKFAVARGLGFRAAGVPVPSWRGFSRLRWVAAQPVVAARQAVGSFRRGRRRHASLGRLT
jgi:coenzyme F420 hydrogenase subunit beta